MGHKVPGNKKVGGPNYRVAPRCPVLGTGGRMNDPLFTCSEQGTRNLKIRFSNSHDVINETAHLLFASPVYVLL